MANDRSPVRITSAWMLVGANALPTFFEVTAVSGRMGFAKIGKVADQMKNKSSEVGGSPPTGEDTRKSARLKKKAIIEAKKFFVIFLYLWVIFGLFQLYNSLLNKEYHTTLAGHTLAFVNALVFAKVMLVAEDLHLGRRFEKGPLIYPIAMKSLLFAAVFIAFHLAEKAVGAAIAGKTIAESVPMLSGGGLTGLLILTAIVTISLAPFFTYKEVARIIGPDVLYHLILKAKQERDSPHVSPDLTHHA